ncbi:hypothetical protein [Kitasatospora griseola]|uniref:hypothetical protein n=1 Tax=Kitasatospora griseola TaxID=2064 RepID=UPI00342D396B
MTAAMVLLFMFAGASSALASDGNVERGGILAPLNVLSSEGVPLNNYDLKSENGGVTDIRSHVCNLLIGGGFAIVRVLVGLMCWGVQWIFNFPIVKNLVEVAQKLNSEFFFTASTTLSLWGLFLAAGVAFGGLLMMRGKVARGAGEMVITLLLSSLVLMPALTPRSILGENGPVVQTQLAAHDAGQIAANAAGVDPGCTSDKDRNDPSCPMRMVLTRTLVVQPYQLLQYGMIADPKSENANIKGIAEVHRAWIHGEFKGKEAGYCTGGVSIPGTDALCPATKGWDDMKAALKKQGPDGQAAYDFAVNSDWDRVAGVGLVLIAALLIAIVVLGMALVHMGCQIADVVAASLTGATGVWAMLPGGNRAALWKWLGVFLTSVVTEFAVSVMLPIFALGTNAILSSNNNTFMIQRLLTLDAFALVLLVFHKRIFAAAGQIGDRFANRMRFAKIGGTLFMGENTGLGLAMSQAMGTLGPGGRSGGGGLRAGVALGGGLLGGAMAGNNSLLRRARIGEGLAALADPALGKMNAAVMAAGAYGEVRKGMAALALPLRTAHHLAVGNPLPAHKLARRLKPVGPVGPFGGPMPPQAGPHGGGPGGHPGGHPGGGPGRPGWPGGGPNGNGPVQTRGGRRVLMPRNGVTPLGHALHNRLLNTRIGRMALLAGKAGKVGWNMTGGSPATLTRLNRAGGVLRDHLGRQAQHYGNVYKAWWGDEKDGFRTAARGVKGAYNAVKATAYDQYLQAATIGRYVKPLADSARRVYEGTALGYDLAVGDVFRAPQPSDIYDPADHGEAWEHARDRGPDYPFFEVDASAGTLGDGPAESDDRVPVHSGPANGDPVSFWEALGADGAPTSEPVELLAGGTDEVVSKVTGEIMPVHQVHSGPAPAPADHSLRADPGPDPAMDPSVLRRVDPRLLEAGGAPLEALRLRRHMVDGGQGQEEVDLTTGEIFPRGTRPSRPGGAATGRWAGFGDGAHADGAAVEGDDFGIGGPTP